MTAATAVGAVPVASDRVAGFDLLRGICALSVAVYHSLFWSGKWGALPHTMGTYAVYTFFALSGASMYVAYAQRFERGYSVGRFLALRFIRLAPLYFLGLVLTSAKAMYQGRYQWKDAVESVLNLSFVLGLGNPGATSQVTGGWSIGIEFVFYLLFPVMLAITASRWWVWLLAGAFIVQHAFVNTVLPDTNVNGAWESYTQFLAFVFYFVAGCAIGRALREQRLRWSRLSAPLLVLCIAAIGLSSEATEGDSLKGPLGAALSLLTAIAVASSATLQFSWAGNRVTDLLGRASYGVYILHPWLWPLVAFANRKMIGAGPLWVALATAAASVPAALVVERLLEKPVQRYLKRRLSR